LTFQNPDCGSGSTRTLLRDGGVEALHGDPIVGPRTKIWTIS